MYLGFMHLGIQLLKCKCTNIAKIYNFIVLKERLMIRDCLAGKVGLGPFWTWVQVLSYVHVLQLFISTFVSSFRHERISTVGKIYTRMQMHVLIDDL
jgi:hypothetical protein